MRRFIPSLSALECFEAAARHRSFTRAADDLGITQSGVSRQIGALEGFLGLKLFGRIGSRLVLTEAGESYLRETNRLLGELERSAIDTVRGQGLDEAFTIEAPVSFATRWLIPRLDRLMKAHPEVLIELRTQDSDTSPSETRADLIIRHGKGAWAGMRADPLAPEVLTVIAAKDMPGLEADGLLTTLDFDALPTLQNAARPDLWMTWLRGTGVTRKGAIRGPRFDTSEALITAARHGLGLALVPRLYVASDIEDGIFTEPFAATLQSAESFWALRAEHLIQHPKTPKIIAWLKQAMSAMSAPDLASGAR